MSRNQRYWVLATLVLGLVVAGTANAQQRRGGFGGFGFGGGTNLVRIAAVEAVQTELALNDEAKGKIATLNEELGPAQQKAYQDAGIDFTGFQDLSAEERQKLTAKMTEVNTKVQDEFNPKLKAIVSAEQYTRLGEIQLQANLSNQGPAALTAAAVATELKLTDEQKKKLTDLGTEYATKQRELRAGGGANQEDFAKLREERTAKTVEVLTAEQKTALEKLKGKTFDVSTIGFGGGRRGGRRGGGN